MGSFLKIAGDYSNWNVYRKSVIICDVTELFINRALPHGSRTIDQMRQAARSCKQNIVEGCGDRTSPSKAIFTKKKQISEVFFVTLNPDTGLYS